MVLAVSLIGLNAGTIEAMCTYTAFRKPYARHEILQLAELQRSQIQTSGYFLNHTLVFRGAER